MIQGNTEWFLIFSSFADISGQPLKYSDPVCSLDCKTVKTNIHIGLKPTFPDAQYRHVSDVNKAITILVV